MNTIKALFGGLILALAANAMIPEVPKPATVEIECKVIKECVEEGVTDAN